MKRTLLLLLTASMLLSFCACGGGGGGQTQTQAPSEPLPEESHVVLLSDLEQERLDALPKHDIPFTADDFSYAGYKMSDGYRIDEIFKVVSETFVSTENPEEAEGNWAYDPETYSAVSDTVRTYFYNQADGVLNSGAGVDYSSKKKGDERSMTGYEDVYFTIYDNSLDDRKNYTPTAQADGYPLLESPVLPGMSRDEVLTNLGLKEISEGAKSVNAGETYDFMSQYGEAFYSESPEGIYIQYSFDAEKFHPSIGDTKLELSFNGDDVLYNLRLIKYCDK